jgi:enamine deaminase RidA (YjgF/YER057c/UK114 family)
VEISRFDDGAPWTSDFGYCRALRVGDRVLVSGTTASDERGRAVAADAEGQTRVILQRILTAVEALAPGAVVVRTRVYLSHGNEWRGAGRAHREVFGAAPPVNTTVEVGGLLGEGLLVEIEAEAIAPAST